MAKCRKYMVILVLFLLLSNVFCKGKHHKANNKDNINGNDNDNDNDNDENGGLKPGKPTKVTYDGRSLLLNDKREIFYSGSIHYPRAPPEMWEELIDTAKAGGLNCIDTYIFWDLHEPVKGKYNFTGDNDIIKFIKLIADKGMWVVLRIGPFIQAEWTQGALPYWLREEHDIKYRTDNEAYKINMEKWVTKVVNLMKENNLLAPQGGPIIMSQIENEYDHVKDTYKDAAKRYIKWAVDMAVDLKTGVPWIMCKSQDAPPQVINACNGRECGDFFAGKLTVPGKPYLWTENWTAQFKYFGEVPGRRSTEDISMAVARWFSRNGSYVNYYMYHGGTTFGRKAGVFVNPRYYDEAPIDEFGLIRGPKWGHLKDLHQALELTKLPMLEGRWNVIKKEKEFEVVYFEKGDLCAAFIWNDDDHDAKTIKFKGNTYTVQPNSVSILPDCKTVVHNTHQVTAQHSTREFVKSDKVHANLKWEKTTEKTPLGKDVYSLEPREQFFTTKHETDYLWYQTNVKMTLRDLSFTKSFNPVLKVLSLGHSLVAYVNGEYVGGGHGKKVQSDFTYSSVIKLKEGLNNIAILGCTVGMPEQGGHLEKRFTGVRMVALEGLSSGNLDITKNGWNHTVGTEGEKQKIFTEEGAKKFKWSPATGVGEPLTWYKAYFDEPEGKAPLAIQVRNMTKGMIWVNGRNIGRFWSTFLSEIKRATQEEYHVPRAYIKPKDNMLVIFDEEGGNIDTVEIQTVNRDSICLQINESWVPDVWSYKRQRNKIVPKDGPPILKGTLQCDKGKVINSVEFASFGNPMGVCGLFLLGNCTAPNSVKIVEEKCVGKESCTLPVDKNLFGNPCPDQAKRILAVQVRCGNKV